MNILPTSYFILILTYFSIFLLSISTAHADTFTVTNLNDSGAGSFRQAVTDANNMSGMDTVVFQEGLSGTISLSSQITITDEVDIVGPGADLLTFDAQQNGSIFKVQDDDNNSLITINISGLRFINAMAGSDGAGAIFNFELLSVSSCVFENNSGTVGGAIGSMRRLGTVVETVFTNNTAQDSGGAIYVLGPVENIYKSTFSNNNANFGGAIHQFSELHVSDSTFSGNSANGDGGAVYSTDVSHVSTIVRSTFDSNTAANGNGGGISNTMSGQYTITQSTFSNNSALTNSNTGDEGAIYNDENGGLIQITNSTFSGNEAMGEGGAIYNNSDMNISFTTIANNNAQNQGGGVWGGPDTLARSSIISFNTSGDGNNCFPDNLFSVSSADAGNYADDDTCGFINDNADINLGDLDDNGGAGQTLELLGGGPLNGAGSGQVQNCQPLGDDGMPSGQPIGIDQRGFPRPIGNRCDAGSFERQATGSLHVFLDANPPDSAIFEFMGSDILEGCGLSGSFTMQNGDDIRCILPAGVVTVQEVNLPDGYGLDIECSPLGQAQVGGDSIVFSPVPGGGGEGVSATCTFTNTLTAGETANHQIILVGTGTGNVSALGIDCGGGAMDCSQVHPVGTTVMLVPTPDMGSEFKGFGGHPDCEDGEITLDSDRNCTARFELRGTGDGNGSGSDSCSISGTRNNSGIAGLLVYLMIPAVILARRSRKIK